jgi:hypothetical protein
MKEGNIHYKYKYIEGKKEKKKKKERRKEGRKEAKKNRRGILFYF